MRWPQFSLVTLGGIVATCAVACCALVNASAAWAATLITAAVIFLMFAATAAVYRQGRARAFWIGVSLWGWLYLLVTMWLLSPPKQVDTWGISHYQSQLVTVHMARWAHEHVLPKLRTPPPPSPPSGGFMFGSGVFGGAGMTGTVTLTPEGGIAGMAATSTGGSAPTSYYPDLESFIHVSQALWLWLLALAGGAVGRWLYATRASNPPAA